MAEGGGPVQVTVRTEDNMFSNINFVDFGLLKNQQSTKPDHADD